MTTPNQGPPDGAFTIGGNELHYGQDYNENLVREMFTVPSPTLTTAIPLMRDALRMAPSGSLSTMKDTFGVTTEDTYYVEDVGADGIVDNLDETWWQRIARAIVTGFTGADPDGTPNLIDALVSMADQKRETTQIAAGLAALRADLNANNNSGKTFQIDMSDFGTTFPDVLTEVQTTGTGTVVNDGNTLEFSNHDGRKLWKYNVEPLLTDYPEVSLVVPRQAGRFFGSYGNRALYWIIRANEDFTTFTFARLNGNKLRVGCVVDGVSTMSGPTWFGSGPTGTGPIEVAISPSSYMTLSGGYLEDDRLIQFRINNRVVATFWDSTSASVIDDLHRWTGFGIQNDADDAINRAPNVSNFMANDNRPAPVEGSGARMSRISTSAVSWASGPLPIPNNFFDFTNERTSDIAVNTTNGGFVVSEGDFYTINLRLMVGAAFPNHMEFYLIRNGIGDLWFGPDFGFVTNFGGGTGAPNAVSASTSVYLNAGDAIQVGYSTAAGTSGQFTGNTTGFRTYLSISRGHQ